MADVKISELTAQASASVDVSADVLALVDTSVPQTKKISVENLLSPITIDKSAGTITSLGTVTGNVDFNGELDVAGVVTANAGVVVDNITIDGTEIDLSSGNLTLDVAGSIILNADGGQIQFHDGGTEIGVIENSSENFVIESKVQDKDIIFKGNDDGSGITPVTIDMSEGGNVGIGTTSINANAKLHVRGGDSGQTSSSNNTQLTVESSGTAGIQLLTGTTNVGGFWIGDSNGAESGGKLYYSNNDDSWQFYNAGSTNSLNITSAGRLGINESSPAELLEISASSSPAIQLTQTGGTEYNGIIRLAGNDLEIRGSGGLLEFYNGSNDGDSSTLAMTIDSSQNASFASRIDFTGKPNIGNRVHSVAVSSGSSSQYNMNGAGGNCSGGFIVGACHRNATTTADNSVCIYAHVHTQGANVYSAIIERNDDSDVTITHNGSGILTCTNNGNSTVNFVVKYIVLTGFDTSNNLV